MTDAILTAIFLFLICPLVSLALAIVTAHGYEPLMFPKEKP